MTIYKKKINFGFRKKKTYTHVLKMKFIIFLLILFVTFVLLLLYVRQSTTIVINTSTNATPISSSTTTVTNRNAPQCFGCGLAQFIFEIYTMGSTVLDVGCGGCGFVRMLMYKYEVFGIDTFRADSHHHCADLEDQVRVVANLSSMPLFDYDQFDLIFSSEVLDRLPRNELNATIRELVRIGRQFFITIGTPTTSSSPTTTTTSNFNRDEWLNLFREHGLTIDTDATRKFLLNKNRLKHIKNRSARGFCHECFWATNNNRSSADEVPSYLFLLTKKPNELQPLKALVMAKGPSARRLVHRKDCLPFEHDVIRISATSVSVCSMFVVAINSALQLVDYADLFVANDVENIFERLAPSMIVERTRNILIPSFLHRHQGNEVYDARRAIVRLREIGYRGPIYLYQLARNYGGQAILARRRQLAGNYVFI